MNVPSWWEFLLLTLTAFRLWKLVGDDEITEAARARLSRGREFVECPWCLGSWIAGLWWLLWVAWPYETLVACGVFAVAAGAGVVAQVVSRLENHIQVD